MRCFVAFVANIVSCPHPGAVDITTSGDVFGTRLLFIIPRRSIRRQPLSPSVLYTHAPSDSPRRVEQMSLESMVHGVGTLEVIQMIIRYSARSKIRKLTENKAYSSKTVSVLCQGSRYPTNCTHPYL